ncbi:MAG: hypothetical protein AB7O45_14265 [Alphaproteobacteria bacterium]
MAPTPEPDHWLVRPATIRWLWLGFIVLLGLTVLVDFLVDRHEVFGLEGTFAFDAWFGFGSCVFLVLFSKALGAFLKRSDRYYGGDPS